jgi:hypothetical protein
MTSALAGLLFLFITSSLGNYMKPRLNTMSRRTSQRPLSASRSPNPHGHRKDSGFRRATGSFWKVSGWIFLRTGSAFFLISLVTLRPFPLTLSSPKDVRQMLLRLTGPILWVFRQGRASSWRRNGTLPRFRARAGYDWFEMAGDEDGQN